MNGKHNVPHNHPASLTHDEARALLQKSLETRLNTQERAALDTHLSACGSCQAYNRNLGRLHNQLAQVMPARWIDTAPVDHSATGNFQNIEGRIRRKRMRQRFLAAAQPVLWTGGVAVLALLMIGLLSRMRPGVGEPDNALTLTSAAETQVGIVPSGEAETLQEALPCTAQTVVDATAYAGASPQSAPLGTLPLGEVVEVQEIHYVGGQEAPWLKIDYQGRPGWLNSQDVVASGDCGLLPSVVITATPSPDEPTSAPASPTPRPTGTPTPLPPPTGTGVLPSGECHVAPTDTEGVDTNIYSGPGKMYGVIGSLQIGEYVLATGMYSPNNYATWVRVSFGSAEGWVEGLYYMFEGDGCWPLPSVDVPDPPPTWTVIPYTPLPTSTLPPEVALNQVIYLSGDIGFADQITGQLPNGAGSAAEYVGIRVNVQNTEVRLITILVQCSGANPSNLRWGYYGSETRYECGRSIESGVSQGGNLIVIALAIPSDGTTAVTYTVTATVGSAP